MLKIKLLLILSPALTLIYECYDGVKQTEEENFTIDAWQLQ